MAKTHIVLVHGWAGSAESWRPITAELEAVGGYRVHAVRLPGSPGSASARPPTIRAAAEELAAMLCGIGEPAVLVGHSMGAQVTLRAHAAQPAAVLSEIVVDPAYGASDDRAAMTRWAERIASAGHVALREFFAAAGAGLQAADRAVLHADLLATPIPVIVSYLRSEYLDADAIGVMPASARIAARRIRPVLTVLSSMEGVELDRGLPHPPGSRMDLWLGHGHFLHLNNPRRFAQSIDEWVRDEAGRVHTGAGPEEARTITSVGSTTGPS
ncbi:pimeloyl-ACP methyl ester carboxylesterase [Microbacterium sp. W4I4]|uniref:alpha/beta fold hydrolase n=1 Tax=Microbacterium sp. W4I4 TaxID=3042295 RepID=UPI002783D483|nr:alpha/beta hydrolase [Microbacterium sp. W4I4]MDQ0615098.1 pimeloyl-ACP methyl ester carboxylesterase [Microbacterium sp. W4I4]